MHPISIKSKLLMRMGKKSQFAMTLICEFKQFSNPSACTFIKKDSSPGNFMLTLQKNFRKPFLLNISDQLLLASTKTSMPPGTPH